MNYAKIFSTLGLTLITTAYSLPSWAMPPQLISLKFPNTGDRGAPATTTGGGTRGPKGCINTEVGELSANALTPNYTNVIITASSRPVFYYYLPETTAKQAELLITDENDTTVYKSAFQLPDKAGIITVPATFKTALSPDKYYQWSLTLICNAEKRDQDYTLSGTLEYKPATGKLPNNATPLEKANFYAEQGIWLETLDNVAQIRSQSPQDWQELLQSVGLEELEKQPLIDCCQSSQTNASVSLPASPIP